MRRFLAALFVALPVLCQPATAPALRVQFLSAEEGRKAITEGAEATYFERLQIAEIRAKTGLALENMDLAQARSAARRRYAVEIQEFSADEKAALEAVLARVQPRLEEKLPLMARTPFSFIKVGTGVEAGLPHTRGAHILLSPLVLEPMVRLHRRRAFAALDSFAPGLLVHEQAHVLERAHPELFLSLFTEVFGFRRLETAPDHPWLRERRVVNPDGPDLGWAFPIREGARTRWIMPDLILASLDRPRMPQDFRMVAVTLEEKGGAFQIALDAQGSPMTADLASVAPYAAAFPNPGEFYHPHEIAADLLAARVTGQAEGVADHPLRAKFAAWAKEHLR